MSITGDTRQCPSMPTRPIQPSNICTAPTTRITCVRCDALASRTGRKTGVAGKGTHMPLLPCSYHMHLQVVARILFSVILTAFTVAIAR